MMNSDTKTVVPSLISFERSDLFTIDNISDMVKLSTSSDSDSEMDSLWEYAISYIPLEFYKLIETYPGMVITEEFNKKFVHNPKACAYDKYETTNMWRPLMILNRCPSILDFDFKYIKYYDVNLFSKLLSVLISRSKAT